MDYVMKIRHRSIKSRVDLLVPTLYIGKIVQLALEDAVEDYPLDVEHYLSDWVTNCGEAHPCKEEDITDDPDAINLCSSIDTPIYMPRLRRVLVEPGDRCRAILHRLYYIVPDFFEYLFVAMTQKVACDATYIYDWMYFALIEACYLECIDRSMALTLASTGDYRTVTLLGKLYEQDRLVKVDYADALMVHAIVCLVGHNDRPTFLRLLARCHDLLGLPIMQLIDALDDETELILKVVRMLDGLSGEVLHSDNFMYEPTNMAFFHRAMKVTNDAQRLAVGDRVQILCGVLKIYNDAVPKKYKLLEQFMDQMNGYSTEDLARLAALLTFVKLCSRPQSLSGYRACVLKLLTKISLAELAETELSKSSSFYISLIALEHWHFCRRNDIFHLHARDGLAGCPPVEQMIHVLLDRGVCIQNLPETYWPFFQLDDRAKAEFANLPITKRMLASACYCCQPVGRFGSVKQLRCLAAASYVKEVTPNPFQPILYIHNGRVRVTLSCVTRAHNQIESEDKTEQEEKGEEMEEEQGKARFVG